MQMTTIKIWGVGAALTLLSLLSPFAQAHTYGCASHLVSDATTQWTQDLQLLQPATSISSPSAVWAAIPADEGPTPEYIWTDSSGGQPDGSIWPVIFTKSFSGCLLTPYQGSLWINGDDSYIAFLNGVPVASCGVGPVVVLALGFHCFEDYQRVGVEILPENELVILAWNGAIQEPSAPINPAMVQYRVDL